MSVTKQVQTDQTMASLASNNGPILVLASGKGWLVVDKPCGMSIHNDPGVDVCSIAMAAARKGLLPAMGAGLRTVHAVHRLDRDTSGVVLLAGDPKLLAFFGNQFAAGDVRKHYLVVVHGRLEGPLEGGQWSGWNWSLTAAATGRKDPRGRGKRLACRTRWRAIDHSVHFSLVECETLTGRKHQIRRHAKLAGHPVVGDRRYGSKRSLVFLSRHFGFNRLGLHAHGLTIRLPGATGATTFRSGGLPKTMAHLMEMDQ